LAYQLFVLALEVLGVVLAGTVLVGLGVGRKMPARAGLAVATAAAAAAVIAYGVPTAARSAVSETKAIHRDLSVSSGYAPWFCVSEPGQPNTEFIQFLARQMRQRDRYVLYMAPELVSQSVPLCLALILLPRVQVESERDADWAVFYGATPPQWRKRLKSNSPDVYRVGPGLALVRMKSNAR
jgi:hypothetical protein